MGLLAKLHGRFAPKDRRPLSEIICDAQAEATGHQPSKIEAGLRQAADHAQGVEGHYREHIFHVEPAFEWGNVRPVQVFGDVLPAPEATVTVQFDKLGRPIPPRDPITKKSMKKVG